MVESTINAPPILSFVFLSERSVIIALDVDEKKSRRKSRKKINGSGHMELRSCIDSSHRPPHPMVPSARDAAYVVRTFFEVPNIKRTKINDSASNNRCLRGDLF